MSEEEKKELKKLKSLLYRNLITQYGKRKLINLYENLLTKQQKETEKYKEQIDLEKDKIRDKIEELENTNFNCRFIDCELQDGNEIKYYILNKLKELLEK